MRDAPDELSLAYIHLTAPRTRTSRPTCAGEPAVAVAGMWTGDHAEGERVLATCARSGRPPPTCSASCPTRTSSARSTTRPATATTGPPSRPTTCPTRRSTRSSTSAGRKPAGPSQLFLVGWGGALGRIDGDHSPLAGRDARFVVHPLSMWEDAADDAAAIAWSRGFRELMAPYKTAAATSTSRATKAASASARRSGGATTSASRG